MSAEQTTVDDRIWKGYTGPATKTGGAPEFTEPLFNRRQRIEFWIEYAVWLVAFVVCWVWWLQPNHYVSLPGLIYASVALAWLSGPPFYYLTIIGGARVPAANARIPDDSRVAMVVTKAPSEPFEVVQETLRAMLAQPRPHDTWLADEDPSPETLAWCAENGVKVSTRKGRPDYHRQEWPRRTRCKEGNLAFFYDEYGYDNYDFVVQLDADHVPTPTYLDEMLKAFVDPAVGYVSAPSICDKNATRAGPPAPGSIPRRRRTGHCRQATPAAGRRCASARTTPCAPRRSSPSAGSAPTLPRITPPR
jgi:cellulose synthase (UDP-forming)